MIKKAKIELKTKNLNKKIPVHKRNGENFLIKLT